MSRCSNLKFALFVSIFIMSSGAPATAQSQGNRSPNSELLKNLKNQSRNEIEREVFGTGNNREKEKFQSGAGQGEADLDERLRRELGAAAEKEDDNPLKNIAQAMMQVRGRMAEADSGPATIGLQKQIVADLDQLIEQARKSGGQCSSSSSSSSQSAQNPAGPPSSKPSATGAQKPGTKPATGSSEQKPGNQSRKPDMEETRAMMKNLWGELPQHVREQMLQTPVEDFVPKYRQLIEDYFRDLSDEKKTDEK